MPNARPGIGTNCGWPTGAVRVGQWWVDPDALTLWSARLSRFVRDHHEQQPLSHGVPVAEAGRELDLPDHLRPCTDGALCPTTCHRWPLIWCDTSHRTPA